MYNALFFQYISCILQKQNVRVNLSWFIYILLIEKSKKFLLIKVKLITILRSFLKTFDLLLLKLESQTLTPNSLHKHIHFD